jgi:CBS domain-containing protein
VIGSPEEQIMADAPVQHPAPPPATVADVMQPPVTTVEQNDHVAAAAYVMKRANATALIVTQAQTGQPVGIITDADVTRAVADGKNPNDVRIYELMTANPTVVNTMTSVRDAAEIMTSRRFRHLPVVGDVGLVGIVDITDVCRALLEADVSERPAAETDHGEEQAPALSADQRRVPVPYGRVRVRHRCIRGPRAAGPAAKASRA